MGVLLLDFGEGIQRFLIERDGLLVFAGDHLHFAFFVEFEALAPDIPEFAGDPFVGSAHGAIPLGADFRGVDQH
ncbi:hypothetical protein SDC9_165390 [bioreactor metagenome]|uniref:Uncharacterized protein n=1 Tax=bioreactor metagenome TaxID=1076179 RepID=A0A645FWG5_9ZZZZ